MQVTCNNAYFSMSHYGPIQHSTPMTMPYTFCTLLRKETNENNGDQTECDVRVAWWMLTMTST
jgi:hypothetical protein